MLPQRDDTSLTELVGKSALARAILRARAKAPLIPPDSIALWRRDPQTDRVSV
jgi:hypothetical protein